MLNVKYCLKLGQDMFEITGDFKTEKEFFQKMAFFSNLPKTAPNGATDLKLVVRETKKGTYYSLVSESEKMEFQIGQHKEGDTLYAKDWVPLYQAETEQGAATFGGQTQKTATAPAFGTQTAAPAQTAAPVQTAAPAFGTQAPAPAQPTTPVAPAPAAQTTAAPAAAVSPAIQQTANNVLSRFGIQAK